MFSRKLILSKSKLSLKSQKFESLSISSRYSTCSSSFLKSSTFISSSSKFNLQISSKFLKSGQSLFESSSLYRVSFKRTSFPPSKAYFHSSLFLKEEIKSNTPATGNEAPPMNNLEGSEFLSQMIPPEVVTTPVPYLLTWNPVTWFGFPLLYLEQSLHIPWIGVLLIAGVAARIAITPLSARLLKFNIKMQNIQPQIAEYSRIINEMSQQGYPRSAIQEKYLEMTSFIKSNHISFPVKYLILQWPILLGLFFGIEDLVKSAPSLQEGGILWFTNLAVPDPYYILPALSGLSLFLSTKFGTEKPSTPPTGQVKTINLVFTYLLPLFVAIVTTHFAAALHVFWISNALLSIGTMYFFKIPAIRTFVGIPEIKPIQPRKLELPMNPFAQGAFPPSPFQQANQTPSSSSSAPVTPNIDEIINRVKQSQEQQNQREKSQDTVISSPSKPRNFTFRTSKNKSQSSEDQKEKDNSS